MATSDLTVTVATAVELEPGPKTVAWLESLGWTAPVDEEPTVELVDNTRTPSRGIEAAAEALKGREAGRLLAQQLRSELMNELSSPERVDTLLDLCGVHLNRLLAPVGGYTTELPVPVPAPVVDDAAESETSADAVPES